MASLLMWWYTLAGEAAKGKLGATAYYMTSSAQPCGSKAGEHT